MLRLGLKLAVYALGIWLAVRLVEGLTFDGSNWALFWIAVILAIVNSVLKPIAKVLSFPVILVTLGLFLLVINAVMLSLTVWLSGEFDLGLASTGFGATFLGALVISIVTWVGEAVVDRD